MVSPPDIGTLVKIEDLYTVDTRTARWQYLEWGFDKWSNENPNINVHFYYPSKHLLLTYFVLWNPLKCFIWEKCYNEHVMKRRRVTDRFALSIINTDISTIYVRRTIQFCPLALCEVCTVKWLQILPLPLIHQDWRWDELRRLHNLLFNIRIYAAEDLFLIRFQAISALHCAAARNIGSWKCFCKAEAVMSEVQSRLSLSLLELQTKVPEDHAKISQSEGGLLIGPTRPFSWLKVSICAFTFKTLC